MQNKLLISICILFFAGLSLYYFLDRGESADLNLIELKTFENSEVATNSKENVALYKKEFVDSKDETREMYLTLGEMRDDKAVLRERLQKVHTNIFWDPNRCAQMLNIIGYKDIVFSDTFKEAEGDGFTTFVYKYDMQQNTLIGYKVGVSLQKLFTNGSDFYGISKQKNIWVLYKLNFETKKLQTIKAYNNKDVQLITSGDELKWCDSSSEDCIIENNFNFIGKNKDFKEQVDPENNLNLKVFFENKKIFELSREDRTGYYILGIRPKQE
jgi:hypothetical protein